MQWQLNWRRATRPAAADSSATLSGPCASETAMIGYVTLGTNDLAKAAAFYDQLLAEIEVKRLMETDRYIFWGTDPAKPALSIIKPYDGKLATAGNGVMVGLTVNTKAQVDALHARAIALGGKDEGAPG